MHYAMRDLDQPAARSFASQSACDARFDTDDVLRSLGFETRLSAGPAIDGGRTYHAELFRGRELMCQLLLAGRYPDEAAALVALRKRLSEWVAEFEGRIG